MAKVEVQVDFDTERDAAAIAFFDAMPEPHKSRVFALFLAWHMHQEALERIHDILGRPIEPGTGATAEQLDAIRAALDKVGLWIDDQGDQEGEK